MANVIADLQEAILTRLTGDSVVTTGGVYRAPAPDSAVLPYVTYALLLPGVDDRTLCGGTAFQHPSFEIISWGHESGPETEENTITIAARLETLLANWAGTVNGIAFHAVRVADIEMPPLPNDTLPKLRGFGLQIRFDV